MANGILSVLLADGVSDPTPMWAALLGLFVAAIPGVGAFIVAIIKILLDNKAQAQNRKDALENQATAAAAVQLGLDAKTKLAAIAQQTDGLTKQLVAQAKIVSHAEGMQDQAIQTDTAVQLPSSGPPKEKL